jgi:hypothetical protein
VEDGVLLELDTKLRLIYSYIYTYMARSERAWIVCHDVACIRDMQRALSKSSS